MSHLVDFTDLSLRQWNDIIFRAVEIEKHPGDYASALSGKVLGSLFFEPSTRTQMSFKTAMYRLGGQVIGLNDTTGSSIAKGESFGDTVKIISSYADIIALRHSLSGAAKVAASMSDCPVINAGDGGHLHPTQTLTDLVTLQKKLGDIKNFTVGFCGDLKNGRTVHSLVKALCHFENIKFVFISTPALELPEYIKSVLNAFNAHYSEVHSLSEAIPCLDVLYMTRIQKERFASEAEYNMQAGRYILDKEKLKKAGQNMLIMHPLPRIDEIAYEVDEDKRAVYFEQAACGVYARMSLILTLLDSPRGKLTLTKNAPDGLKCQYSECITGVEHYLPASFTPENRCEYCEQLGQY